MPYVPEQEIRAALMVHIIFILLEIGLVYFWVSTKEDVDETIRVVIIFAIEFYVIYDRLKDWIETRKARNAYKGTIYEIPKIGKLAYCRKMGELIAIGILLFIGFMLSVALGANPYAATLAAPVFVGICVIASYYTKEKIKKIIKPRETYKGSIYENPKIRKLADCCKMGDIEAMWELALFFRERCEKSMQELLDAYEADPVQQNEEAIENYLKAHSGSWAADYMMWLVRAAVYGNENANLLIEKCSYYQRKASIPYTFYTSEDSQTNGIWVSRDIGLIDMVQGLDNGGYLTFYREKGYYDVEYLYDYDPPDETGFGAEWNYENAYYDEFFCQIPTSNKEMISQKLLILEQERKAYWDETKHKASERKYKKRLCVLP